MSTMLIVNRPRTKLINRPLKMSKRIIDIVICLIALPFVFPLGLIVATLIKLDSPGPALFKQKRIGKGRKPFEIYKFRTMGHNCDKGDHHEFMKQYIQGELLSGNGNGSRPTYKPPIEKQVTKVGRFLRKTSIDELPQLFNVLRGDMSLVGPRPNVPWEVDAYDGWHNERLEVEPGITGLAQVKGRSGIPFSQLVKYDVEYVKRRSILLDIKIVWWTFLAVIKGDGAG